MRLSIDTIKRGDKQEIREAIDRQVEKMMLYACFGFLMQQMKKSKPEAMIQEMYTALLGRFDFDELRKNEQLTPQMIDLFNACMDESSAECIKIVVGH